MNEMRMTGRHFIGSVINAVLATSTLLWLCSCTRIGGDHYPDNNDTAVIEMHRVVGRQYCFRRISGVQNRDTLTISMQLDGNFVIGDMTDAIFEKDVRQGKLVGALKERSITATWTFIQEGIIDTLQMRFQLENGRLLMAPLVFNERSGRQEANFSSSSWIDIPESDCSLSKANRK